MTWEGVWSNTAKTTVSISPTHAVLLDLQRISQTTRRRYGAEGNTGKYDTSDLGLSRLLFCLSLRCSGSWSCSLFYFCGFFLRQTAFTDFGLHPPWCWASHSQSHISTRSPWCFIAAGDKSSIPVQKDQVGALEQASPSELWAGGLRCHAQDVVGHGAAIGRHLYCALCAGTTRAGGMCHKSISSLCPVQLQALPHWLPPQYKRDQHWPHICSSGNPLLKMFIETKAWGNALEEQLSLLGWQSCESKLVMSAVVTRKWNGHSRSNWRTISPGIPSLRTVAPPCRRYLFLGRMEDSGKGRVIF